MRLAYSGDAVADLVRLREFIAETDPAAAARVAKVLIARVSQLREFPMMGRAVALAPDPESVRDMTFGNYVVRDAVTAEAVVVLRVWHRFEQRDFSELD